MNFRRYIPGLVLVIVVVFLLAMYLPGYLRLISFKRDLYKFLALLRKGDPYSAAEFVIEKERGDAFRIIREEIPEGYEKDISALSVRSITHVEGGYEVEIVGRFEGENYRGAGRARVAWHKTKNGWKFRLSQVLVAELFGENWTSLYQYLGFIPGEESEEESPLDEDLYDSL